MRFRKYLVALVSTSAVALLSACGDLGSSSSNAGQEFTAFSPNVQAIGNNIVPTNVIDTSAIATTPTPTTPTTTNPTPTTPTSTTPTPVTPTTTTDTSTTTSTTDVQISNRTLAGTGIVWKPVSEGDGRLVVLTPTSYGRPSVSVLSPSGSTVEAGRYVGHTNGNRATYRFGRSGGGYSAPAYLKVGDTIFLVSSPSSRYN